MNRGVVNSLLLLLSVVSIATGDGVYSYEAVVFGSGPSPFDVRLLRVFPLGTGKEADVLLPEAVRPISIAGDGETLYAQASPGPDIVQPPRGGIFRIDLRPVRMRQVPNSGRFFVAASGLAIWPDQQKLLISGAYLGRDKATCGVYELAIASGAVRNLVESPSCDPHEAWTYLSLSRDGHNAIAIHKNKLDLIDLERGSIRSVGDGFEMAAWSPDGKWIAAREHTKEGRTVLVDAASFVRKRILESTEAMVWSPDSRYLLAFKLLIMCGPETYSLEKIDIETGVTSIIESSRCKASGGAAGWVRSGIQ